MGQQGQPVEPLPRVVGGGKDFRSADEVALKVMAGETVTLTIEGQELELSPDEILIQTEPAEGLAIAADKVITVKSIGQTRQVFETGLVFLLPGINPRIYPWIDDSLPG